MKILKKYFYIPVLIIIAGLSFYVYKALNYTYITVKFQELRPFHAKLPVYYKGLVIGKATERRHSDDFQHTLINVTLYPKNLLLPVNTEVLLKKEKRNNDKEHDFLELVYPQKPSDKMISNGTILNGKATVDIETFLANQNPDDLEIIKNNLAESSENLNSALGQMSALFLMLNDMLDENRKNINSVTRNLSKTTGNIDAVTRKLDRSMKQQALDNTFSNIEASTKNFTVISSNLTGTSFGVNEVMPRVDSTLYQVHGIASNANAITCGIRKTLRKPFGGLRLMFGKVITECDNKGCAK